MRVSLFLGLLLWLSAPALVRPALGAATDIQKSSLSFEPNLGQVASEVRYFTPGGHERAWLTDDGPILLSRRGLFSSSQASETLRLRFLGRNRYVDAQPQQPQRAVSHYLRGDDPAQWKRKVPHFEKVRFREMYRGIDVVYYGHEQSLEYDFIVSPGADPRQIRLEFTGVTDRQLTREGDLLMRAGNRLVRQQRPTAYQLINGRRIVVDSHYYERHQAEIGISVGRYDRRYALVIDPVILYSDLIGASQMDQVYSIATDAQGNAYVASVTDSPDFPTTAGAYSRNYSSFGPDLAVTKLDPAGAILWSTLLGQVETGSINRIAVDTQGAVYVAGSAAPGFPVVASSYRASQGRDGFVAKLSADGSQLLYTAFLGTMVPNAIAVDGKGRAFLAGEANGDALIVPPATGSSASVFQSAPHGYADVVVAVVNAAGTGLDYATYLGGSITEIPYAIAITSAGEATITGVTGSIDFPTTPNVYQPTLPGGSAAFVTRLNSTGSALVFSTFLGATGAQGTGIGIDAAGNTYVAGNASTGQFPVTTGAYQANPGEFFLTKLNPTGSGLLYSTLLGTAGSLGPSRTWPPSVQLAVDAQGRAVVAGETGPGLATTPNALLADVSATVTQSGGFVTEFDTNAASLVYSSYFPQPIAALALDDTGKIYLGGSSTGTGFPAKGLSPTQVAGDVQGFVTKLDPASANICPAVNSTHPPAKSFGASGGMGTYTPSLPGACETVATSSASWVIINGNGYVVGSQPVSFTVAPTTTHATRTAVVQAGGQPLTISQAGAACTYSLNEYAASVGNFASGELVSVYTPTGCAYHAASDSSWLTFSSTYVSSLDQVAGNNSLSAGDQIPLNIAQNTGPARTGHVTIADQTLTITQQGTQVSVANVLPPYHLFAAYTLNAGDTGKQTSQLRINSDGPLFSLSPYSASVSPATPVFVTLAASAGFAPGTLAFSVDPAGLGPGTYLNTVNVTVNGTTANYPVSLTILAAGGSTVAKAGVFRPSPATLLLDHNGDGLCCQGDIVASGFGQSGDVPLAGDWTGSGTKRAGLFRPANGLILLDVNGNGTFDIPGDRALSFPTLSGDIPVVGDWTGIGVDRLGISGAATAPGTWTRWGMERLPAGPISARRETIRSSATGAAPGRRAASESIVLIRRMASRVTSFSSIAMETAATPATIGRYFSLGRAVIFRSWATGMETAAQSSESIGLTHSTWAARTIPMPARLSSILMEITSLRERRQIRCYILTRR